MTCEAVRNRVLSLADPREVPDPLRAHLAGCPGCAAWWDRAVRVERLVAALPVPPAPTEAKAEFLDDLTADGPVIRRLPALDRRPGWATRLAPAAKYLAGLAAAVLVAAGGWWAVRPGPGTAFPRPTQKHPLLDQIVQRNRELAQARRPDQRLEVLGRLADDLAAEAGELARYGSPDELRDLTGWFRTAVADGVVPQAGAVAAGPDERAELIAGLADRLDRVRERAEGLVGESPPHALTALQGMADTARDGRQQLRALVPGGGK